MQHVSEYFSVNIIVFDDIKDKKIYGNITGLGLEATLNSVSWFMGCEWISKDGVYYIGGNAKNVLVIDSAGIDKGIESVFDAGKCKILKDKIIVSGTERELSKISSALKNITDRKFCKVYLHGFEVTSDKNLTLGIDIQKSFEYAFSTANFLKTMDPVTHLSLSVVASLRADCDYLDTKSLIDTHVGLLTGEEVRVHIGQDYDRAIYTQSQISETAVVSGYNTQTTGLILVFKAFHQDGVWYFKVNIENSTAKSDVKKLTTTLDTVVKIVDNKPVLLCELSMEDKTVQYEKGIPFLADIPYLGYFFRVTTEINAHRKIYFTLQLMENGKDKKQTQ